MIGIHTLSVSKFGAEMQCGEHADAFTKSERAYCDGKPRPFESYAGLMCAKHAVIKALRACGIVDIKLCDVEITHSIGGAPCVVPCGAAEGSFFGTDVSISVSHDGDLAIAACIAEKVNNAQ